MRTCSYTGFLCTGQLLHTYASTNRGFHTKRLLHSETFTHRCTKMLVHSAAFTPRPLYTQTLLHTEASTQRNLCTEQLLHKEVFLSPAPKTPKKANSFFPFLPFPFQITNAVMDDTEISRFLCLSFGFPFSILRDTMLDPFLQTDAAMHSSLYTEAFIRTCSYTERFVHRETFIRRRSQLFGRTCSVAV